MDLACPQGPEQLGKTPPQEGTRHGAEYNRQCRPGSTVTDADPDAPFNSVATSYFS